jgi:hypothetical protein
MYDVDIVLCIDGTGSMAGIIENVKEQALFFYEDLQKGLSDEKQATIGKMRLKVIVFRDYYAGDGYEPMEQSPFFDVPDELPAFAEFVKAIRAAGGASAEENSLEAVAYAMKSDWTKGGLKRRHLIVLWTDDAAHPLEKRKKDGAPAGYPDKDMPASLDALSDLWDNQGVIDQNAKRWLVFAPQERYPWSSVKDWRSVFLTSSRAGEGLSDHDYSNLIKAIAASV